MARQPDPFEEEMMRQEREGKRNEKTERKEKFVSKYVSAGLPIKVAEMLFEDFETKAEVFHEHREIRF